MRRSAYFPSPFEKPPYSPWTAWASGPRLRPWAAATELNDSRKFTFRTRSAYFIPRSRTTQAFKVNSGEYKVMGLAPYGEPTLRRENYF